MYLGSFKGGSQRGDPKGKAKGGTKEESKGGSQRGRPKDESKGGGQRGGQRWRPQGRPKGKGKGGGQRGRPKGRPKWGTKGKGKGGSGVAKGGGQAQSPISLLCSHVVAQQVTCGKKLGQGGPWSNGPPKYATETVLVLMCIKISREDYINIIICLTTKTVKYHVSS